MRAKLYILKFIIIKRGSSSGAILNASDFSMYVFMSVQHKKFGFSWCNMFEQQQKKRGKQLFD